MGNDAVMKTGRVVIHRGGASTGSRRLSWRVWLVLVLVIFGGVAVAAVVAQRALDSPQDAGAAPKGFVVREGDSAAVVLNRLEAQGLVRHAGLLFWAGVLSGQARHLQPGTYELSAALPPREILRRLAAGDSVVARITIPEGLTVKQIAALLGEKQVTDPDEFLRLAATQGRDFTTPFPHPGASLEGYLFPDTYDFRPGADPKAVIERMLGRFTEVAWKVLQPALTVQPADAGAALHDIVTLASLVEGEAKLDDERARIAGVLSNRLRDSRPLECDATIQYALPERKAALTFDDLQVISPYNTYQHAGLPPGPINSPGLASLRAALAPESTPFQYYVARPSGAHYFSRTLAEHEQATQRARKESAP